MAADKYDMSLASQSEYSGYAVPGLKMKATGEQTSDAMIAKAGELPYAGEQMSNGSMDYLAKNADLQRSDVSKVKRTMKKGY